MSHLYSIAFSIILVLVFNAAEANAQSSTIIKGRVSNNRNETLIGANLHLIGMNIGGTTDNKGQFEIAVTHNSDLILVVSYVGFQSDTINCHECNDFLDIILKEASVMDDVVIKSRKEGVIISDINPIKTETITQTELKKAACCDLAGCFETQTTVQPQTTNVITNSKELRILGLSGVYNQILIDGMPMIQGLSYTYGISSIPGTLVENIHVSKGANSVVQGFESISGQINVETKDPHNTDRLLLNAYVNNFFERHLNINYSIQKEHWSNITAVHTVQSANKIDRDEDDFLDLPLLTRYLLFNKWKYGNDKEEGWSSTIGLRYLYEQRIGGQSSFDPRYDKGSTIIYGQSVEIGQPEIWLKSNYRISNTSNFRLLSSFFHQNQNSYFGSTRYDATQSNFYANIQYEHIYSDHDLKAGLSYRQLRLQEDIGFSDDFLKRTYDGTYRRNEGIFGIFAENTMSFLNDKITWIAGLRADHHNEFGVKVTPRTLIKYDIAPRSIIRASLGRGWRTVNLFSENIGLLVSSRDIVFAESLLPEQAMNYGINFTQKFEIRDNILSGYISTDFYKTNFQNQIFPDYDTDPTKAIINNFTGTSVSNGFQVEILLKIYEQFELKTGYNYLDVYRMIGDKKEVLPFNPKDKILMAFSYQPTQERFHFDMNLHWFGRQRLPDTKSNPIEFRGPDFSESYTVVNAQFTYNFPFAEVYFGCENIFDFRQLQPIISWQDPFSQYFDTSSVWGPTRGREMYIGVRYRIK